MSNLDSSTTQLLVGAAASATLLGAILAYATSSKPPSTEEENFQIKAPASNPSLNRRFSDDDSVHMMTPISRGLSIRDREDKKVGKEVLIHRKKTRIIDADFTKLAGN
jgi:hypothetical protein